MAEDELKKPDWISGERWERLTEYQKRLYFRRGKWSRAEEPKEESNASD